MSHPSASDELRRSTESKLLRHRLEHLRAAPPGSALKASLTAEVDQMVDGIVLLGIPDELAWTIELEGQDTDSIGACALLMFERSTESELKAVQRGI